MSDRKKELLGLIASYWRLCGRTIWPQEDRIDTTDASKMHFGGYPASWAESEACLREVAGECAAREAEFTFSTAAGTTCSTITVDHGRDYFGESGEVCFSGTDPSRSVALLRAFIAAFTESK